jgi:hypothetical protein
MMMALPSYKTRIHTLSALALSVLVGCAGRTPAPVAVTQAQDGSLGCSAIQAESSANAATISELDSEQGGKIAQNVVAGVAGLFIWPLWFALDLQGAATKEIAALEQRNEYLTQLAGERCAVEPAVGRVTAIQRPR